MILLIKDQVINKIYNYMIKLFKKYKIIYKLSNLN